MLNPHALPNPPDPHQPRHNPAGGPAELLPTSAGMRAGATSTSSRQYPQSDMRRVDVRACVTLPGWCEQRWLELGTIRRFDVTLYIDGMQQAHKALTVKRSLAAVRMLCGWLVTDEVMAANPTAAVRGPKHVVKTGWAPMLEVSEWRRLLDASPAET